MYYNGIDIIEIARIGGAVARSGERFLRQIYTDRELEICNGCISSLAAGFAAKEAVMKALGTGARGVGWKEIEILPDGSGKPLVRLHGRARRRALELNLDELAISLSHSRDYAVASVVGGA